MVEKYFTAEKKGEVTVIRLLRAELSLEDADDLKKALYGFVSEASNKFIVDLHQCGFLSSAALGMLVCLTARIHSFDGRIVLCDPTKEIAAILDITKLGRIYDIYPTLEEAFASFTRS